MTPRQQAWFDDLSRRDPAHYSARERKFMDDMHRARRAYEEAERARFNRDQAAMVEEQWGGTHPGWDTAEGREMENPRR